MSLFIHSVCKGDVRVVCCHHNVTAALLCWLSASLHLAAACSGLQQVSETACSHMHAYPQQREHTHTHTLQTHTPLVCLVATVTQKSSEATHLQTTYDAPEFPFPAQAQMCVRK